MKKKESRKNLIKVEEIISDTLKKIGVNRTFGTYSLLVNWRKIVGKEIADNSFVSHVERGILVIKVKNSVWSHHLMMLKSELIKKINCYLGENLINNIRFMAGNTKDNQNYRNEKESINSQEDQIIPQKLNTEEIKAAKKMTEEICDDKIRNKITYLLIKELAIEKAKKDKKWEKCLNCEVLVPPGKKYCTICQMAKNNGKNIKENKTEKDNIELVKKTLLKSPWLSYDEINKNILKEANAIDISLQEYQEAKRSLVQQYIRQFYSDIEDKTSQITLVMLLREIKPENMTQAYIDSAINEVKKRLLKPGREKYVSASRD